MARLGKTLAQLGRTAEARSWLEKAVKLAPTRRELRLALIEQLVQENQFAQASREYETLLKGEPGNPDLIRDWGRLMLRDTSKAEADRKAGAAAIWKRMAGDEVKDPVVIARTADLFRSAELVDEAIALYGRAILCAADPAEYRESLGEYYHQLKRPADALATWRSNPARTAAEKGRLGEVLAGFGYRLEAIDPYTEAVKLAPDDLDLRLKLADLFTNLDRPKDALEVLSAAAGLADSPERVEAVLGRQIQALRDSKTLDRAVEGLRAELDAGKEPTAARWTRLARLLEAAGKSNEAVIAASKATAADPKLIAAWSVAARLQESTGNLGQAVRSRRTLASLDRRNLADHLATIARLETRLGRKAEALQAGRELLAQSPGSIERHEEFSQLCVIMGEIEEGLETLRRASRANPTDPRASNSLADLLARQSRTEEAIEVYWRSFERTKDIEGRLGVVSRLAEQYLLRNQLDRLTTRLERDLREPDRKRDLALCLAQAYREAGDLGAARERLEAIRVTNPRDVDLLLQLSSLAEADGDDAGSARYLKQAVDIAPRPELLARLATLYLATGEVSEAEAIWSKLASTEQDAGRAFSAIDHLMSAGKSEKVLSLTSKLLQKQPGDWDALYREGVALASLDRTAEAARRFRTILDLKAGDDDPSSATRSKKRGGPAGPPVKGRARTSLELRWQAAGQVRFATGLDVSRNNATRSVWTPADFGQARMAALGWLSLASNRDKEVETWLKSLPDRASQPGADSRLLWDVYYLEAVRADPRRIFDVSARLARALPDDPLAQFALLSALPDRDAEPAVPYRHAARADLGDRAA